MARERIVVFVHRARFAPDMRGGLSVGNSRVKSPTGPKSSIRNSEFFCLQIEGVISIML